MTLANQHNLSPNNLSVFDLDGTLIAVDSFVEVTKVMMGVLLRNHNLWTLLPLTTWCCLRKARLVSHLSFKRKVVRIFERALKEADRQRIVNDVFVNNINKPVFDLMLKADNCLITTASPYAYTSRMPFGRKVVVISSLMPGYPLPCPLNFREGKVDNIKAYLGTDDIRVANFYTDSDNDQALVDISDNAFLYRDGELARLK